MKAPSVPALFVMLAAVAMQPIVRCAELEVEIERGSSEADETNLDEDVHDVSDEGLEANEVEHSEENEIGDEVEDETGDEVEGSVEEIEEMWTPEPLSESQLSSLHSLMDVDKDGRVSLPETLAFSRSFSKTTAMKDVDAILEEFDKSHDGKLSLEEYLSAEPENDKEEETENFHAVDEDGDKLLNKAEVVSLFFADTHDRLLDLQAARRMKANDKDGDGKLSFVELFPDAEGDEADEEQQAALHEQFAFMDTDGDGFVKASDIRYIDTLHLDAQMAMRDMFDAVDTDKDKHVSLSELVARNSDILDSDAYGHLTQWVSRDEF